MSCNMMQSSDRKPMQPWKGIADSMVPANGCSQDYAAAMQSPCESCATAPCCSYLPLTTFRTATLSDLDYAVYLLNFERIELGLSSAGDWNVFYRHPCRFLDRKTFACTVHEQPEQPHICRRYNPYRCWYKTALTRSSTPDYVRLDRARLQHLITGTGFDDQGNIIESPDWPKLVESLEHIFDPAEEADPPSAAPVETRRASDLLPLYTIDQVQPCNGCAAYCCKVLMFPIDRPVDASGLDYIQFCLGFPGIRVGISDALWAVLVDTKCRHLQQNRCALFGQPQRPLACRYYDEWRCVYRPHFEEPEKVGVVYAGLEQYRRIVKQIELDRNGAIVRWPAVGEMRQAAEEPPGAVTVTLGACAAL